MSPQRLPSGVTLSTHPGGKAQAQAQAQAQAETEALRTVREQGQSGRWERRGAGTFVLRLSQAFERAEKSCSQRQGGDPRAPPGQAGRLPPRAPRRAPGPGSAAVGSEPAPA